MKPLAYLLLSLVCLGAGFDRHAEPTAGPAFGQGIMVGEVTDTSAIVQVRVTQGTTLIDGDTYDDGDAMRDGDLPGMSATVTLTLMPEVGDESPIQVVKAIADNDYIAKAYFEGLRPGRAYHVVATADATRGEPPMARATFKTHPGERASAPVRFVLTSCMNYDKFTGSDGSDRSKGYRGDDRALGYPAAEAVLNQQPDFVIYAGDVVYYRKTPPVKTLEDMRAKWHRQNNMPRMIALHAAAPGYWLKDDWDYRANDSDPTRDGFPPHDLGIKTFREQVPIVPPADNDTPTYRTHRLSKDLQIWFVEGRDYRDPNKQADGPDKTLWGDEQLVWLKQSMLASDATYRILVSPTPMVGPDDGYKRDNHTNHKGFKTEGDAFKAWGKEHGIWGNTFLMCGDRHWQYHSIDPSGAHEFSCGAFNDENSRMGRKPGDKRSTDPEGLVIQPWTYPKRTGGFLSIAVEPATQGEEHAEASISFAFFDDLGKELYRFTPQRP
ncbi:MAG: alkaline phosphatase D family protein [Phycisphaeraceae bacterium]